MAFLTARFARCSSFALASASIAFAAGFASLAASAATQTAAENATITVIISFFISFSPLLNYLTSFVMAPPVAMPKRSNAWCACEDAPLCFHFGFFSSWR